MCRKDIMRFALVAIAVTEILATVDGLNVTFDPPRIGKLFVDGELNVTVSLRRSDGQLEIGIDSVKLQTEPASVLGASFIPESWSCQNSACSGAFKVTGLFLGFGKVFVLSNYSSLKDGARRNSSEWKRLSPPLKVTVLRPYKCINTIFTILLATAVTINYINFGCALETDVVKEVLERPVFPFVVFVCQFVMPLVSYGVGYLLFTDPVLRLGLFTFACSPGGGASNMWTALLGGNLSLSITMTIMNMLTTLGSFPAWFSMLGNRILEDTDIEVPYTIIITSLVRMIIPIAVGLLIQRFLPGVAACSKKFLTPICFILLTGTIAMSVVANTYVFYMLSWQAVIAASIPLCIGFLAVVLVSLVSSFPYSDKVALTMETGIQNIGLTFVILSYSLPNPVSDMAAVVAVAASMIIPIPLFLILCAKKVKNCFFRSDKIELQGLHSTKDEYPSTKCILDEFKDQELELEDAKSDQLNY